jgi:hypothetical protein
MSYNGQEKLPGRCTQRTINRLQLTIPIYLNYNGTTALNITEGRAPFNIDSKNRITRRLLREHKPIVCKPNPIKIAIKYQRMYEDAAYQSMEKVAQELGITRARVCQMLNLLKLDQRIIDFIQNISNPRQSNFWNEHRLRSIALLPKKKQYGHFQKLNKCP